MSCRLSKIIRSSQNICGGTTTKTILIEGSARFSRTRLVDQTFSIRAVRKADSPEIKTPEIESGSKIQKEEISLEFIPPRKVARWFTKWSIDRVNELLKEISSYAKKHDGDISNLNLRTYKRRFKTLIELSTFIKNITSTSNPDYFLGHTLFPLYRRLLPAHRKLNGQVIGDNISRRIHWKNYPLKQSAYSFAEKILITETMILLEKLKIWISFAKLKVSNLEIPSFKNKKGEIPKFYDSMDALTKDIVECIESLKNKTNTGKLYYLPQVRLIFSAIERELGNTNLSSEQEAELASKINKLID